MFCVILATRCR